MQVSNECSRSCSMDKCSDPWAAAAWGEPAAAWGEPPLHSPPSKEAPAADGPPSRRGHWVPAASSATLMCNSSSWSLPTLAAQARKDSCISRSFQQQQQLTAANRGRRRMAFPFPFLSDGLTYWGSGDDCEEHW